MWLEIALSSHLVKGDLGLDDVKRRKERVKGWRWEKALEKCHSQGLSVCCGPPPFPSRNSS